MPLPIRYTLVALVLICLCLMTRTAQADIIPYEVGTGENQAYLALHFSDDAQYLFDVNFTGTTTGLGLFDIIEAELSLTTVREDYGYGTFIDGISFDTHSDTGYGGGEDWWHYWTKDAELDPWESSLIGVSDRIVADGYYDGWRYGSALTPVPEPHTLAVLITTGALLVNRKRSQG